MPNDQPSRSKGDVLLVAGVARSGTSALARSINLLGAEVGRETTPPAVDNQKGFWENSDILVAHESILGRLGSPWADPFPLPEGWWLRKDLEPIYDVIRNILKTQFDSSATWVIKDPRLCRLAPIWIQILSALGKRVCFIIPIRHPCEVAQSFYRNQRLDCGQNVPYWRSYLIWICWMIEIERYSRPYPRVFVQYDDLLERPIETLSYIGSRLEIKWPVRPVEREGAILEFLDRSLKHNSTGENIGEMSEISKLATMFYDALRGSFWEPEAKAEIERVCSGIKQQIAPTYELLKAAHQSTLDQLAEISRLQSQMVEQEKAFQVKLEEQKAAYNGIANSHTWRATFPLRRAMDCIKLSVKALRSE